MKFYFYFWSIFLKAILGYYIKNSAHYAIESLMSQSPHWIEEFRTKTRHDHVDHEQDGEDVYRLFFDLA